MTNFKKRLLHIKITVHFNCNSSAIQRDFTNGADETVTFNPFR